MTDLSRAELARFVDHTLLKTDAAPGDVAALIAEARDLGVYSVCVSPSMLPLGTELGDVLVATVCGFPSGKHRSEIKAREAAQSVADGADEVDMVIDIGMLKAGNADAVEADIRAVREAIPGAVLKVIIESAALSDDEIVAACKAAERARADFVKTSTGFHAEGGASVHAVEIMKRTVDDRLGIKASGGIRDYATAIAMIDAGATRLGLSGTKAVLDGCLS